MTKNDILNLYKEGTQKRKIVYHILTFGSVTNWEIKNMNICCHTARLTEIRQIIELLGFVLVAKRKLKSNTYTYTIKRRRNGKSN